MVFWISFTGQDLEPRIRIRKPDPHHLSMKEENIHLKVVGSSVYLKFRSENEERRETLSGEGFKVLSDQTDIAVRTEFLNLPLYLDWLKFRI